VGGPGRNRSGGAPAEPAARMRAALVARRFGAITCPAEAAAEHLEQTLSNARREDRRSAMSGHEGASFLLGAALIVLLIVA